MSTLQRIVMVNEKPSRMQRVREALRSYWVGPISSDSPELARYFGARPVSSGVAVNESTALCYSAVWAAVTLISSQVGNLPCILYKKDGRNKDRYESHPLYRLVHDRPNPEMSAFTMRETMQAHLLTWGNAYAEIERNGSGRPVALWPITPDRVAPYRRTEDSILQYRVTQLGGGQIILSAADMVHIPGLGYDGVCGYSVIAKARESLGLGIATERFGGTFFGNGSTFGGVISYPGPKPTELAEKNYREAIETKHMGVDKAHKFLALYNGASYSRLGIPPNDAQFLETRTFQIDEVARWFNLPPHKLKELMRSTNNNIEHQNLEYYIDCLAPWLERWEQELNEKLISPLERNTQEIEFIADGLLRGDVSARGEFHSKQFNTASITPNEIRALENRNPLEGGDRAFVPLNMIPLDRIDDWIDATLAAKKPAPAPAAPPPTPEPKGPTRQELQTALDERETARQIAQEALVKVSALEAAATELRTQITSGEEERKILNAALEVARADVVTSKIAGEQITSEREAIATELRITQAALTALDTRQTASIAAIRAAVVDDLAWLIEHESDRARAVQGSPDKLRAWLQRFYAGHEDRIRKILRPSVRAWIVCTDYPEALERVLDHFVAQYVEQSQRQLRTVADEQTPETLPAALEQIFRRWDIERAEFLVSRVLRSEP